MPNAAPTRRLAIGALGAAASGAGAFAQDQRPNTLVVLVDDLRWDALSVMGHPFIKTPNIDRIAREGVRFDHAYVTTPLCSPSRASFLTGQWVHKHEVNSNGDNGALSMKLRTFPQLQQKAGYETAFIGKWHMGNEDAPRPGFDRWVSFKGQGVYNNPVFNIDGKPTPQSGYITDLLSASAVDFLKKRRGKPFSLFLAHKAVHGPFTPAERHKTLYANETIRRAASSSDTLESKPALRRTLPGDRPQQQQRGPSDETIRAQLQCLASIDDGVGRILAALEETRQLDNTMIVFTSDNGYFWGEHGLGDKRAAYDESIRIPMLIRYPRLVRPGTRLRNFVLNTDLAPTMVEVSRATPVPEMKGRSLVPLLAGRARGWRTSFFCEYFEEAQFPRIPSWQAIRTERWKYIRYTNLQGMDELYDLASDAGEMRNLAGDASANGALEDCKEEMARLWRESF